MARAVLSDIRCGAGVSRRSAFGRLIMAVKTTARIRVVKMAVRVCKNTAGEASGKNEVVYPIAAPPFGSAASPHAHHESQIHRDLYRYMKDAGYKRVWSRRRTLRFSDIMGRLWRTLTVSHPGTTWTNSISLTLCFR